MNTPIRELLLDLSGKRPDESVLEFLDRISAETHPSDHAFRNFIFNGVCVLCGWVGPDAVCDDCGAQAVGHVKVYRQMVEKLGERMAAATLRQLGFAVVLPPITVTIRPKGWDQRN